MCRRLMSGSVSTRCLSRLVFDRGHVVDDVGGAGGFDEVFVRVLVDGDVDLSVFGSEDEDGAVGVCVVVFASRGDASFELDCEGRVGHCHSRLGEGVEW